MLRNASRTPRSPPAGTVLNEVLSLNAQESRILILIIVPLSVLNEVLSLNAQELVPPSSVRPKTAPQ